MAKSPNVVKRAKVPVIEDSRNLEKSRVENIKKKLDLCSKIVEIVNSPSLKKNENPSMRVLARKLKLDQRTFERYVMFIQHIQSLPKLNVQIVETDKVTYIFNMENGGSQK